MDKNALVEKIEKIVEPITSELSYELYYVEYVKENGDFYLRIYIDKEEGRVSLNDCEAVSRRVSEVLDAEDPIESAYYLEVSSPGLFRMLYTKKHFEKVLGKEILVKFNGSIDGQKSVKGILKEVNDDFIVVESDKEFKITNDKIKSANLEGEV
ncbi:ribosome maturation factor RimP [Clostridium sp. SM-530-WT-3G]|uniref:ribosome maturation factor RimP n=1 Tax=Clostridium sp. SM-530-WT-3G TaxID=2725303 RepID=UPI00145D2970|nr:ribosome maturation factor RimP [Clostridium sp. SM-530-WT-3G]NME81777.1 ribosome maturation factor RimP [Clostridium sp. SM-530-WT-3G]